MLKSALITAFQQLFVRPNFTPFFTSLYKLSLRGLGVLNSQGPQASGEKYLWRVSAQAGLPIKTVFDVGANDGGYSLSLHHYFPKASYYCLEPHPHTFQILTQNTQSKPLFYRFNLAVSDKSGQVITLYDFASNAPLKSTQPTSTLASVYPQVISEYHNQPAETHRVKTISLDEFAENQKISHIDWLNIDVEGHELAVLHGAQKMLESRKIKLIQVEFNEMNVYSHTFFHDLKEATSGYHWFRLLTQGWIPLDEYRPLTHELYGFQNLVCATPSVAKKLAPFME